MHPHSTTSHRYELRFWAKVEKSNGCWEWRAGKSGPGYGEFSINNRPYLAHRVSWELTHGPIPLGLCVCHICDNRRCVRPDHLFLGTRDDNNKDMTAKGRQCHGEAKRNARLTPDLVRDIRTRASQGASRRSLSAEYGISTSHLDAVIRGVFWKYVQAVPA